MERKYRLSDVGNVQVIDMLKEKISVGATKIRRYEERELYYHQKTLFETNQKQFYKKLDGRSNIPNKAPMLKKVLDFGAIFDPFLESLTKILHGSPRSKKG